jgi:serine/threonine protein kinase
LPIRLADRHESNSETPQTPLPPSPPSRIDITEASRGWEGQTIKQYPLIRHLGGNNSAVFSTEHSEGTDRKAAIKVLALDPGTAQLQLSRWQLTRNLSHPHLVRLLDSGRCELEGIALVYVVTEYAQQNLSQFVPRRSLSLEEVRAMLEPTLSVLSYLHGGGLVHGRIRPANIMGVDHEFKLSSDSIFRGGELVGPLRGPSAYNPLEGSTKAPADIWSLGMVLMESLTQELPAWEGVISVLPSIPEPFLSIARHCLHRDPSRRRRASDIAASMRSYLMSA